MSETLTRTQRNLVQWFTDETYCGLQRRNGWYVKDCLETKVAKAKRCYRCRKLAQLVDELSDA